MELFNQCPRVPVFRDSKSNLSYIVQEDVAVPSVAYTLLLNQRHSFEAVSIQAEMTTRLSHNHLLFQNDNTLFYGILEEDVCGIIYDTTIKTFHRMHDGHGL